MLVFKSTENNFVNEALKFSQVVNLLVEIENQKEIIIVIRMKRVWGSSNLVGQKNAPRDLPAK